MDPAPRLLHPEGLAGVCAAQSCDSEWSVRHTPGVCGGGGAARGTRRPSPFQSQQADAATGGRLCVRRQEYIGTFGTPADCVGCGDQPCAKLAAARLPLCHGCNTTGCAAIWKKMQHRSAGGQLHRPPFRYARHVVHAFVSSSSPTTPLTHSSRSMEPGQSAKRCAPARHPQQRRLRAAKEAAAGLVDSLQLHPGGDDVGPETHRLPRPLLPSVRPTRPPPRGPPFPRHRHRHRPPTPGRRRHVRCNQLSHPSKAFGHDIWSLQWDRYVVFYSEGRRVPARGAGRNRRLHLETGHCRASAARTTHPNATQQGLCTCAGERKGKYTQGPFPFPAPSLRPSHRGV